MPRPASAGPGDFTFFKGHSLWTQHCVVTTLPLLLPINN